MAPKIILFMKKGVKFHSLFSVNFVILKIFIMKEKVGSQKSWAERLEKSEKYSFFFYKKIYVIWQRIEYQYFGVLNDCVSTMCICLYSQLNSFPKITQKFKRIVLVI